MRLYFMRHAAAVDIGEKGVTRDADRMLSGEGIRKTKAVSKGLKTVLETPLARIIASPFARAKQTAEIVARAIARDVRVELRDSLKPNGRPAAVIARLRAQPETPTLLVGHMPDLSLLAAALVTGTKQDIFQFKKNAVLCLEFDGTPALGRGRVAWFIDPSVLRRLSRK